VDTFFIVGGLSFSEEVCFSFFRPFAVRAKGAAAKSMSSVSNIEKQVLYILPKRCAVKRKPVRTESQHKAARVSGNRLAVVGGRQLATRSVLVDPSGTIYVLSWCTEFVHIFSQRARFSGEGGGEVIKSKICFRFLLKFV
jgi:hypothetical protein